MFCPRFAIQWKTCNMLMPESLVWCVKTKTKGLGHFFPQFNRVKHNKKKSDATVDLFVGNVSKVWNEHIYYQKLFLPHQ